VHSHPPAHASQVAITDVAHMWDPRAGPRNRPRFTGQAFRCVESGNRWDRDWVVDDIVSFPDPRTARRVQPAEPRKHVLGHRGIRHEPAHVTARGDRAL